MFPHFFESRVGVKGLILVRWFISIWFFFLAITKGMIIFRFGLEPYETLIELVGLPWVFSYYGLIAVFVELYLAVGLWDRKMFNSAILFAGVLTIVGIVISVVFVLFKINSECGCGLLGDSEYGLLAQKVLIVITLIIMYKNKDRMFVG